MAVYPSTIGYLNPVSWDIRFKTIVSQFDDLGEEQRKQKWLYPRRDLSLSYQALSKNEGETLWEFYIARGGAYDDFVIFESTGQGSPRSYSSEYVATGDSTTLAFGLPAIDSTATLTVNIDSSATASSNYATTAAGGPDGEDKITFVSSSDGGLGPPTSTQRITCDFTGRLKIRCRFAEDVFSFENFYDRLINHSVKLQGLLNS